MEEKLSDAFGGRNFVAGAFVRLDIGIVEKRFAFLDPDESVRNVRFASSDRFYLAALQLDAGFVALENVKIAEGFAIKDRLGRHDRASGRAAKLGGAVGRILWSELVGELSGDDFAQSDIGERGTWGRFDERTMAQPQ